MTIIDTTAATTLLQTIATAISDNTATILILFGAVIGISIVMALLDSAAEDRKLTEIRKRWER